MLRWYLGASGSAAGALSMASYMTAEQRAAAHERLAQYYAGEAVPDPLSRLETLAQDVADGRRQYPAALDELLQDAVTARPAGVDLDTTERQLRTDLTDAIARARLRNGSPTVSGRRLDMDPALMARLGIDPRRSLELQEIAHLLNGLRADGERIQGKQVHAPMRPLTEVFGLNGRELPSPEAIGNILDGRRADGQAPQDKDGIALSDAAIAGARKRFLAAYGVQPGQEATEEQLETIRQGLTANGLAPVEHTTTRALNATRAPIGYADMIWSPDKSVSVAWALAETQAERSAIEQAHNEAVAGAMAYVEHTLGVVRLGRDGAKGTERGTTAWLEFKHYTSRPTLEFKRTDKHGEEYTEFQQIATKTSDMQLHTHAPILNLVLTPSGKAGSIDFDRLDGRTKEFGGVYNAILSTKLQALGANVELDPETGVARLADIPRALSEQFSRRTSDSHAAAREAAKEAGIDWDALTPAGQRIFLQKGVELSRNRKELGDGPADFTRWKRETEATGYRHQFVLGRTIAPELTLDQRRSRAYETALDFVEQAFTEKAVINGLTLREAAARSLVETGTHDPLADINAITQAFRQRGVRQDGETVRLVWGQDVPTRGKERVSVTTEKHLAAEAFISTAARQFAHDHTAALAPETVDRAVQTFLAKHPEIKTEDPQWRAQRPIIGDLTDGRRLGLVIGVAGAGKSTIAAPVVDAMHAEGRQVFGVANAWKHATVLADAGIPAERTASIAAFLKRVERSQYQLGPDSTVIVDEVSRVGQREMLGLLQAQQRRGFQLLMIGDPKQSQAIDAPVMQLLQDALGDQVPQILTSIRQRTDREREIAGLFREGKAGEAIALKREDGTAILAAGGRDNTIARVADLWRERMEARGSELGFTLTVSAPTNQDAQDIGRAIRQEAQRMGRVEADQYTVQAAGPRHLGDGTAPMPLALGDQVRVHNRLVVDRHGFASNGDTLTVREATAEGMRATNERGQEAVLAWSQFRQKDGPVRLSYGYASTIDASQGSTSSEHIDALVSGSAATQRNKGYVAESRQRDTTWLIVSEAAERQQIMARVPRGAPLPVLRHDDIWQNAAANLSQEPTKSSATAFIERATSLFYGTTTALQTVMEPIERSHHARQAARAPQQPEQEIAQQTVRQRGPEPPAPAREMPHQSPQPPEGRWADMPDPVAAVESAPEWRGEQRTGTDMHPANDGPLPEPPTDRWGDTPAAAADHPPAGQPGSESSRRDRQAATPENISAADAQADFVAAMERIGLQIQGAPRVDGQKHPVAVEGNARGKKSGFYRFDGERGFGLNSKTGEKASWPIGRAGGAQPLSDAQREADRQARIERQQEQQARDQAGAAQARRIWDGAMPASPGHPYLFRKGIPPGDLRQGAPEQVAEFRKDDGRIVRVRIAGRLIIPLRDSEGELHNVQLISPDGGKLFLQGRKRGLMATIGPVTPADQPVIVAEGYATASSLRDTTALTAVAAIDAGNLLPVAEAIRRREPQRPIIFGADNDHRAKPGANGAAINVGAEKAQAAARAVGGIAVTPAFGPSDSGSDWNDYVAQHGRAATRAALEKALDGIALPPMPAPTVRPAQADAVRQRGPMPPMQREMTRFQRERIDQAVVRDLPEQQRRVSEQQQVPEQRMQPRQRQRRQGRHLSM
jgi:phage/plasmid primase-like uncharacterized protein